MESFCIIEEIVKTQLIRDVKGINKSNKLINKSKDQSVWSNIHETHGLDTEQIEV